MKDIDYCYWLQGYFENSKMNKSDEKILGLVKDRLQLVFTKVTSGGEALTYSNKTKLAPKEFVDWLRGYLDAIKTGKAVSPLVKAICDKLDEVKELVAEKTEQTNEEKFKEYIELLRKNNKPTYLRDIYAPAQPLNPPSYPHNPIMCNATQINTSTSISC